MFTNIISVNFDVVKRSVENLIREHVLGSGLVCGSTQELRKITGVRSNHSTNVECIQQTPVGSLRGGTEPQMKILGIRAMPMRGGKRPLFSLARDARELSLPLCYMHPMPWANYHIDCSVLAMILS